MLGGLGRQEASLAAAEKAVQADPTFVNGHVRRGDALAKLSRWGEARAAYEEARGLDATNDVEKQNKKLPSLLANAEAKAAEAEA